MEVIRLGVRQEDARTEPCFLIRYYYGYFCGGRIVPLFIVNSNFYYSVFFVLENSVSLLYLA